MITYPAAAPAGPSPAALMSLLPSSMAGLL